MLFRSNKEWKNNRELNELKVGSWKMYKPLVKQTKKRERERERQMERG